MNLRTPSRSGDHHLRLALVLLIAASALLVAFSSPIRQALAQQDQVTDAREMSVTALNQIRSLISEKLSRTPTQRKIDSQILATIRLRQGKSVAPGVDKLKTDVEVTTDERTKVDIRAHVTLTLQQEIVAAGGEIIAAVPRFDAIRALIPLDQIEALAALPDVRFIGRAVKAQTRVSRSKEASRTPSPLTIDGYSGSSFEERAQRLRWRLPNLLSNFSSLHKRNKRTPASGLVAGSVVSEGDKTHRAAEARTMFGVDGTGVKIGVLSDSVDSLAASQAAGELGAVTVLPGQSGVGTCGDFPCSGEGTAMLEIIHDLAPGAQLYFATATISEASFAENVLDLRAAGCDIIVDDIAYLDESPFQDGIVAQAVNAVTADGALYFSAAGNGGNLTDGTSSVWEGDFANGGQITVGGQQVTVHSFGSGIYNSLINGGGNATGLLLFWSDPLGLSANDYDLYILDSTGTVVHSKSDNFQTGSQDPFELVGPLFQGQKIVIVRTQGASRFLHLGAFAFEATTPILSASTSGEEFGHATATNCIGVAAVPAASPFPSPIGTGPNPTGPFPNAFTAANHIERFSSDGPRRVFYNPDGTAITPGNFLATGGLLRQKPDIAAADGVSTTFPSNSGLNPFFGTSAAAPHAAAIAALLKSFVPSMTAAEIRSVLKSTAIDIESPGVDRDSGSGIVMALPALQSVATGVNLSTTTGAQTVTQGQNAVYSIAINRRNFAGAVNLSISGLPTGASASFNPASTTGDSSILTITSNSATAVGTFAPGVTATASGVTIFPLSVGLTVNSSCNYSISPSARNLDSSGGGASVTVSAVGGCAWTATATESWITINSGSPGTGGGTVNYSVAANSGGARTGRILIADQMFVITQSGNNPAPGNWIPTSKMRVARYGYSITLLQNGKVLVAGGVAQNTSTKLASAELYDPSTGTWSDTGSINTARYFHEAVRLQNGKVLVIGGRDSSGANLQTAELYDPLVGTWANTGSMAMIHEACSATLLPSGKVLIAGGYDQNSVVLAKAELYDPLTGTFNATGDMTFASNSHVAILMQNGKVLTVGGYSATFRVTNSAQLYDPTLGTWSTTNGMNNARLFHSATLLANGKVLVAGGEYNSGRIQSTVEIYDPGAGTWSPASPMLDEIELFTMTLLPDGKVLVTGGNGDFNNTSSAEIFDPATGRWRFTANMSFGRRSGHSAVLLQNGSVLVVGGPNDSSPEIFNPGFTGNWSLTGSMIAARWDHTATLLNNGKVLVVGGNGPNGPLTSTELYDHTTGLWTKTGSLVTQRRNHTATLLENGKVLVAGGNNGLLTLNSAELYDPMSGNWTPAGGMLLSRSSHTATLLSDGRVLVTGGNSPTLPTNSAELYDPASGIWTSAANMILRRSAHTATLLPSGIVLVVGTTDESVPRSETFNPATGKWTAFAGNYPRSGHTATLLFNGTVLISGGVGNGSSELFTQGVLGTTQSSMAAYHFYHAAALLPNGRVLIAGGDDGGGPGTAASEVYNQQSGVWQRTTDLIAAREFHTATLLPNGKVLVAGGVGGAGALSSVELYDVYPGCSFALNQSSKNIVNGGESGTVNVIAGAGCLWSAVSNASFITITSGATGTGNGTVGFSVAASNLSNPRTGTITIGDQTFTITQAGGAICTYSISPGTRPISSFGGAGSFSVATVASDCAWTAINNADWITVTPPANSAGNGTVNYTASVNSGAARSGTITLSGQTHTVNQDAGPCTLIPIGAGSVTNGSLATTDCRSPLRGNSAYADRYSFNGTAGQQISILLTAAFDTYLYLLNPDNTIAASDDDGGGGNNSRIPAGSGLFTLPVSGTYAIETTSFSGNSTGAYNLTLTASPSPGNDQFVTAQAISGPSGLAYGSNVGATKEPGEPNHAGSVGGKSVWYRWQAPSDGSVRFNTFGSSFDTLLAVYKGSSVSTLTQIATNDNDPGSGSISQVTFSATAGTVYQIAIDGNNSAAGKITLNWTPPPSNDDFGNAQAIAGGTGSVTGSSALASKQPGEPNHADNSGRKSLWYRWQAPGDGNVTFTTNGSSFDTLLGVYTGSSVTGLTFIVSNDDERRSFGILTSKVAFNAVSGVIYQIAVDGFSGDSGNVLLTWSLPSANNDFANPQVITGSSGSVRGNNQLATKESGEPNHAGNPGGKSLWFRWQAPGSGNVTFTTNGSNFNTLLGVYTGSSVSSLTLIASNNDDPGGVSSSNGTSKLVFSAVAGTVYQIAVDGSFGAFGNIILSWGPTPANDNFANAQVITGSSGSAAGHNVLATKESGEPGHAENSGGNSVWYRWQAPGDGNATFATNGSNFDTLLGVYSGSSVNNLTLVGNNDDDPGDVRTSKVAFGAVSGTVYQIAVDGYSAASDSINLNWSLSAPTPTPTGVQLNLNGYIVGEGTGTAQITVIRTPTTGVATVDYVTSDNAGLNECNILNGSASSRCDYATSIGTVRFTAGEGSKTIFVPIVDDAYAEGNETLTVALSNPTGITLGSITTATITIHDNEIVNGGNPIDGPDFFIRQNYIDFLGREPDPAGLAGWRNVLVNCGITIAPPCDRIEVSAGFFRSEEFQSRGYFIYRFYSAVGRIPLSNEFFPDFAKVSGFLTADQLEANKVAYVNEFMARTEFQTKYSSTFNNPTAYVDALLLTVGLPNHSSRAGWIAGLTNGSLTRAQVLRQLVESSEVYNRYYNEAFVIMQYFGYLRRTADASYLVWIQTMNQNGGDYRTMINGFMNSAEYRRRFGP
ncbi:MAG: kelch repeat-containing protein [Acidobacteriota bacterium]